MTFKRAVPAATALILALTAASASLRRPARLWRHGAEIEALRAISRLQAAESDYAVLNGGFHDRLECLFNPRECLEHASVQALLDRAFDEEARRLGYRFVFFPGRPGSTWVGPARPRSSSSIQSFAYVAIAPLQFFLGPRTICGDSTSRWCVMRSDPATAAAGRCPDTCEPYR